MLLITHAQIVVHPRINRGSVESNGEWRIEPTGRLRRRNAENPEGRFKDLVIMVIMVVIIMVVVVIMVIRLR